MVLHQEEGLVLLAGGVQQHGHEEDVLKQRGGSGAWLAVMAPPVVKPRNTDLEREVNTSAGSSGASLRNLASTWEPGANTSWLFLLL